MKTRKTMTISLPPEMAEKVDRAMKCEHRTRSELVREALRLFLQSRQFAVDVALPEEKAAMKQARAEYAKGEYVTLDQLLHEMGDIHRTVRK